MPDPRVILVTFPDESGALKAGEMLVAEGLAACVSVVPAVKSVYRWKGKIERSGEALAIIKSQKECFDEICRKVKGVHPYDCPEIISLPVQEGFTPYLEWVLASTRRS